jgi:hypothetical protein
MHPDFLASNPSRRRILQGTMGAAAGALCGWTGPAVGQSNAAVATRAIPQSGERIPVIGLGTANDFMV